MPLRSGGRLGASRPTVEWHRTFDKNCTYPTRRGYMPIIVHPIVPPAEAIPKVKAVQDELLSRAESLLGTRDMTNEILAPRFLNEPCPRIYFNAQAKTVYISLSTVAADSWNAAEAEMSHEVVHLLNPVAGDTNYLEEGVATAFAQYAASRYGFFYKPDGYYKDALDLVRRLADDPLGIGRLFRTHVGALSEARSRDLMRYFPDVGEDVAESLARKFSH